MKINKKGQSVMDNFGSLAIGVVALCITLVVAFLIMSQAKTTMTTDGSACAVANSTYNATTKLCNDIGNNVYGTSIAYNSTKTLQNATDAVPGWVPIIIITAIGAALIGMVAMFRR